MDIGKQLKELRKSKALSQQNVADFLGIHYTSYGKYENNLREPDAKTLCKLADYFNVTTDYILGRTDF